MTRLRQLEFDPAQRTALAAITPGAAARILATGKTALQFIEQVEYNGRRLAKLNLPPSAILEALQEYDRILTPVLASLAEDDQSNFQWVREQLHFCVTLTLNNAYYQVREAETQSFYELFRIELESRNLHELLRRFLDALVHSCNADAGRLYMLWGEDGEDLDSQAAGSPKNGRAGGTQSRQVCPSGSPGPHYERTAMDAIAARCSIQIGTSIIPPAGRFLSGHGRTHGGRDAVCVFAVL